MAEIITTMLLFFAVMVITAVVFGVWVLATIFRLIGRAFGLFLPGGCSSKGCMPRSARPVGSAGQQTAGTARQCPNTRCGAPNPLEARFCRRCGQPLPAPQRLSVRRVAVW